MLKKEGEKTFPRLLLKWNRQKNRRQMPWKGEKDAYLVWLSEIILQQTRVEQGLPYYLRFKKQFPNVRRLAEASEDEVMKLWQGLGYYSRARNLHETAKNIHHNYSGQFPGTFNELRKLKGVGDYTAAAIASFVFGEKKAVVDGNVIRVLARCYGVKDAFDTTTGKKKFATLAQELIDSKKPGEYNQAIMDFGATVCLPQSPKCADCPLQTVCIAYQKKKVASLPVRSKRTKITNRYFNYLLIHSAKEVLIQKRTGKDIWKGLYELPLIESEKPIKQETILKLLGVRTFTIGSTEEKTSQRLSHRNIHFRFIPVRAKNLESLKIKDAFRVCIDELSNYAFPKTIRGYLTKMFLL